MGLPRSPALVPTLTLAALTGWACTGEPTGLRVSVHLGALSYDELRFGVVEAGVDGSDAVTLIDPETVGRRPGPFRAGDQDVVILLADEVSGHAILCDVTALYAGSPTGSGHNAVLAQAHHLREMDVFMEGAAPDDGGAPGDDARDGAGGGMTGEAGTGGGPGSGGTRDAGTTDLASGQGGSQGGSGGATGVGGRGGGAGTGGGGSGGAGGRASGGSGGAGGALGPGANGARCTDATACASLHCVDGVCCESACDAACSSCRLAGQEGRCRLVAARTPDPRGVCIDTGAASCGTNGQCDATGRCARYPFGTACPPPCADAQSRFPAGICSLTGTCVGIGTRTTCPAPQRSCLNGTCL